MPSQDSSRDYDLLDRLVEEFNERFRKGERPSVKEYCDRHPDLADDLRELLPALAQVEQAKDGLAQEGKAASPAPPSAPVLQHLGDFRILREVGHGGMGVVYEAEQVSLGRRVALKVLTDRLMRDDRQKRRFEREARAAAKLHHTNIVPVFGTGEAEGVPFYVMQFIQGTGLDVVVEELARISPSGSAATSAPSPPAAEREVARIAHSLLTGAFRPADGVDEAEEEGTCLHVEAAEPAPPVLAAAASSDTALLTSSGVSLPGTSGVSTGGKTRKLSYWQSVARIGAQVADALEYAHKQGVVHRDIKPSNLLLDLNGTVWVTDFGLAKAEGGENLTHTGDILGTLRYMPPEAFDGKADGRGDVYSLGLTLYELIALRPAFDQRDRNRLVKQVTTAEVEPLGSMRRRVPRDLETIVHKASDRDPARRYQTAGELRDDLQRFVDDEPILARRQTLLERYVRWARHHPGIAVLGAVLTAVLVLATAGSLYVAGEMSALARSEGLAADNERTARKEAEDARQTALAALADADAARDKAQRQVVKFDVTTAAQQAERGELELALHWAARAWQDDHARLKPGQSLDPGAEANHRLRLAVAIDRLPQLVGFCPHDRPVVDSDCDPTGDRVVTVAATLTRDSRGAEFWTEQREHVARVWSAGRAELVYPPLVHEGPVTSAVFSADGRLIATSSADGTARVWEAATGKTLFLFRPGGPVARVALSPDGKTLAAAVGERVQRWDTATGEPAGEPIPVGGVPDYVAYSPEGSRLVTVTRTGQARVWDAATAKALGAPLPFFRCGEKQFRSNSCSQAIEGQRWPAFSRDGKQLAASDGSRVLVWSEAGTRSIAGYAAGSLQIHATFNPAGTQLIFGARQSSPLTLHDLASRRVVATGSTPRMSSGLAISPDGKRAAVPVSVGNTVLFDLPSGGGPAGVRPGPTLRIPDWVSRVWFTRDSRRLLTASWDGTVRVWQLAAPSLDAEPYRMDCGRADRLEFPDRRFSPDGTWVAVSDASKPQLRVGPVGSELRPIPGLVSRRYRFSPDGRHLVTFHQDEKGGRVVIETWKLGDAGPGAVGTTTLEGSIHDLVFSADGRRLGVGVRSRTFKPTGPLSTVDEFFVFEFPSLEPLLGPVGGDLIHLTGSLGLSPDGGVLVVGQVGAPRLACWDVRTGKRLPGGEIAPGITYSIDVGLRDERVLAALSDRTITQWDARTGRRGGPTIRLPGDRTNTFHVATYSPDQTRIAQIVPEKSGTWVKVFSALDGDLLASHALGRQLNFSGQGLPAVWFSTDSRRVIVHQRGTTQPLAWTLPAYPGPLEQAPALVRLLTGTGSDPVGGFFPLPGDAIRTDPETYRQAFRAWKGLADDPGSQATAEERARRAKADQAAAHQALGLFQISLNQPDEARLFLEKAATLWQTVAAEQPKDIQARADLAVCTRSLADIHWKADRLGEWRRISQQGVEALQEAVRLTPSGPLEKQLGAAHLRLADRYAELGLWAESAAEMRLALERVGYDTPYHGEDLYVNAGRMSLLAGDPDGYRKCVTEGLRLRGDTDDPVQAHRLLLLLSQSPDTPVDANQRDRLAAVATGEGTSEDTACWGILSEGASLYRAGKDEQALDRLKECLRVAHHDRRIYTDLFRALALHRLGRLDQARAALDWTSQQIDNGTRAAAAQGRLDGPFHWSHYLNPYREASKVVLGRTDPHGPYLRLLRGRSYARLGEKALAEAEFAAGIAARPSDPDVLTLRARIYADLGWKELAAADVARSKELLDKLLAGPIDNPETAGRLADQLLAVPDTQGTVLRPRVMRMRAGTTLTVQADGSVLAGGNNPDKDFYVIDAEIGPGSFTCLCLEALPHASLPGNGPGRSGNGNFALSEISLQAMPAEGKGPAASVPFVRASSSYVSDTSAPLGGAERPSTASRRRGGTSGRVSARLTLPGLSWQSQSAGPDERGSPSSSTSRPATHSTIWAGFGCRCCPRPPSASLPPVGWETQASTLSEGTLGSPSSCLPRAVMRRPQPGCLCRRWRAKRRRRSCKRFARPPSTTTPCSWS